LYEHGLKDFSFIETSHLIVHRKYLLSLEPLGLRLHQIAVKGSFLLLTLLAHRFRARSVIVLYKLLSYSCLPWSALPFAGPGSATDDDDDDDDDGDSVLTSHNHTILYAFSSYHCLVLS